MTNKVKYKEAKDILSDCPNELAPIKEAQKKMESESTQPDWHRWWFSHSIAEGHWHILNRSYN